MAAFTGLRTLWKTGLLVFQKQEEVTLQVLTGYLSLLLYSGDDCEQNAAWRRVRASLDGTFRGRYRV